MTDKELIKAARKCQRTRGCGSCTLFNECPGRAAYLAMAADRLEALLAENELLREATKMMPKWFSVEEKLPEESGLYFTLSTESPKRWIDNFDTSLGKFGAWWDYEPDGTKHPNYRFTEAENITHWMPIPEPPSTEGVE